MDGPASVVLSLIGMAWLAGWLVFAAACRREREGRAAGLAVVLALIPAPGFVLVGVLLPGASLRILELLLLLSLALVVLALLPIGRVASADPAPRARHDERDIMFARNRLRPGTPEYESYYRMRPQYQAGDDATRARPGLLSLSALRADPFLFPAAEASFDLTEALRECVDGPVAEDQRSLPPVPMTAFIKGLARYFGALDVGVAALEPYHVYSHVGRGSGAYGEPIVLSHRYAIAFTVEMNAGMVGASPAAPSVMESARQYVEAARVSLQLAGYLRRLGHSARAHIDGNYRVVAPLVARDAGLGEIGRIGLLMTPRLGPRVRLGVVTTDLELVADARRPGAAVIDFCTVCKKCADNCPSGAIPLGGREEIEGALRWKIDAEACFRYWQVVGTDCGVCMNVCPYSHPDSAPHNAMRWLIARSGFARRAALWLDDRFYGRKPPPKKAPSWVGPAARQ